MFKISAPVLSDRYREDGIKSTFDEKIFNTFFKDNYRIVHLNRAYSSKVEPSAHNGLGVGSSPTARTIH